MGIITDSELWSVLADHQNSLPYFRRGWRPALAVGLFVAIPVGGTLLVWHAGFAALTTGVAAGLLGGVGVLGGFLFQVLAWVSGRMGAIADDVEGRPATDQEMSLIGRLDIARANIAYSSLASILLVADLGLMVLWAHPSIGLTIAATALLFHLGLTLMLTVLRINQIGKSDRLATITAAARARSQSRALSAVTKSKTG